MKIQNVNIGICKTVQLWFDVLTADWEIHADDFQLFDL